jgi:hypothetical protein
MTEKGPKRMECNQFEALLLDELDGLLSEEIRGAFHAHAGSCPVCGPIFTEARQGMLRLQALEELEPPSHLVGKILAATTGAEVEAVRARPTPSPIRWGARLWKPLHAMFAAALQPRFATSFSMAFFSLSLTLTLAGVKFKNLARIDWRPTAVSKAVVLQYTQVESKVVRYYNNMRLVYELESRVRKLKQAGQQSEKPEQPKPEKKKKDTNDTSGRPEQRQDNYSRETDGTLIAYLINVDEGANHELRHTHGIAGSGLLPHLR